MQIDSTGLHIHQHHRSKLTLPAQTGPARFQRHISGLIVNKTGFRGGIPELSCDDTLFSFQSTDTNGSVVLVQGLLVDSHEL